MRTLEISIRLFADKVDYTDSDVLEAIRCVSHHIENKIYANILRSGKDKEIGEFSVTVTETVPFK